MLQCARRLSQILEEAAELDHIWGAWEAAEAEPTNDPNEWLDASMCAQTVGEKEEDEEEGEGNGDQGEVEDQTRDSHKRESWQ
jgi:hypothetical protein